MGDTTPRIMRSVKRALGSTRVLIAALFLLLVASPSHAETYFYHTDHLGTPQVLTNKNQTVVWQAALEPFGEVSEAVAMVEQNLRFPGQYLDRESGLHYNYFRSYNSDTGRYTQSDLIGLDDGPNTYSYAGNSPLNFIDESGQSRRRAGPSAMQGIVRVEVENLVRNIRRYDPTFTYNSYRNTNYSLPRYNQRDINTLTSIYNRTQSAGFCGPGASNAILPYTLTRTNQIHASNSTKQGIPARPFMNSSLVMRKIISTGRGRQDKYTPHATRYDVQGTYGRNTGMYDLVITPNGTILHFNFTTK